MSDVSVAALADADAVRLAVGVGLAAAVADAAGLPARRADDLHVAHVHRRLLRDDAALLRATRGLGDLGVLLDAVRTLNEHAVGVGRGLDDLALEAAVLAPDHQDGVALLHEQAGHGYSTSGASEMIFMKRLSRSSRPTGPKMRVPRGSPPSLMRTAAFSSKRM